MLRAILLALCFVALAVNASDWKHRRAALDLVYQVDEFRIFYSFSGVDALPAEQRADIDRDGVPDLVQNIAIQLVVGRNVFTDVLELRHPLASPRYRGKTKYIDVNLLRFPLKPGGPRRGTAGDAIVNFRRPIDESSGVGVLVIDLSNMNPATNLTPAHELFHLFQNGYTMFKNRWFTEGTASWVGYVFKGGPGPAGMLPTNAVELERLMNSSYEARRFWIRLSEIVDPSNQLDIPDDWLSISLVGSATNLFADGAFTGKRFIKVLLEQLDDWDDRVSRSRGLAPYDWRESVQRSADNNLFVLFAVRDAVCEMIEDCSTRPDLKPFMELLN